MEQKSAFSWKMLGPLGLAMLSVLALAVACAGGGSGAVTSSVPAVQNSISVSGTGDAYGAPDVAYIQLGIDVTADDVGTAITQAGTVMDAVQTAVKGQGVDEKDLQTINFNVYPEDIYDRETGQPTGQRRYHVQNFLNAKVRDISKIGAIIDAGLGAGATNVSGLSFGVEDKSALETEARTKAIADAKARAQELADGLGVKLGGPIIVSEGYVSAPPMPYPVFAQKAADGLGAGGGAAPISPGQMQVTVQVNIIFALEK